MKKMPQKKGTNHTNTKAPDPIRTPQLSVLELENSRMGEERKMFKGKK